MNPIREVVEVRSSRLTEEGAGVRLHRAFAEADPRLDPLLLFDDFGSENSADYVAGFPMHPHRGMETVTYLLEGRVSHRDSLGNRGTIGAGDVQWMTAGSGIIHEEMPEPSSRLRGYQLWANLPAKDKMTRPRYQDVRAAEIPEFELSPRCHVRLVCGTLRDVRGPVQGIATDPLYLDASLEADAEVELPVTPGHNVFVYVVDGSGSFGTQSSPVRARQLALFGDGGAILARAGAGGCRFLLAAGRPLREPVAWGGPIVMNTAEELSQAFAEYRAGTFLKHR